MDESNILETLVEEEDTIEETEFRHLHEIGLDFPFHVEREIR